MKPRLIVTLCFCCSITAYGSRTSSTTVTVNADRPLWTISPYLLGAHFVYPYEKDSIYADGHLADWMAQAGVGVIRYPGGSVTKYWHWEDPTGVFSGDRWDPGYDPNQDQPESAFMDLDEYLAFCKASGAEPMVGVNIHSGYTYNRVDDAIAEATRCVHYCKFIKRFPVRWWYIGNEEPISMEKYAQLVNRFAPAMRAVDPNIRIIVNFNKINASGLKKLLGLAGDQIDMVEFHGKWKGFKLEGSFEMWADEVPLVIGDRGYTYSEHIQTLRQAAAAAGYPNLLLANNEWGLGSKMPGFDKYHRSLVMVDYLLDLFKGNFDMACLWSTQWPGKSDQHLLDAKNNYRLNPIGHAFELLASSLGEGMLPVTTDAHKVYGFASQNEDKSRLQIYLFNKSAVRHKVTLDLQGFIVDPSKPLASQILQDPGLLQTGDITWLEDSQRVEALLPAFSFARLSLPGLTAPPPPGTIATKPNVLIVYSDDVGWGDPPCYNPESKASMPTIDRLAEQGMLFTDASTVYGTCAPSRYGILTGNWSYRGRQSNGTWVINQPSQILDHQKTLGNLFQEAGYRSAFFGKMHLGGLIWPKDGTQNFDTKFTPNWSKLDFSRPLVAGLMTKGFDYTFFSHSGVQAPPYVYFENDLLVGDPEELIIWKKGQYDLDGDGYKSSVNNGLGIPDWDSTKTGEQYTRAALDFMERHVQNHPDKPFFMHFCTQCVHVPHTPATFFGQQVAGTQLNGHLDMLYEMDLQVKALMDKLAALDRLEETLIIFTSDNGGLPKSGDVGHDSSGYLRGFKGEDWEGGHRVPFLVRWGDGTPEGSIVPPQTKCTLPISQTDLFATFAHLLKVPQGADQGLDSLNILPYLQGDFSRRLRRDVFSMRNRFSFRRDGWKIIASKTKNNAPYKVVEVYHLAEDPTESNDLINDPETKAIQTQLLDALKTSFFASRSTPVQTGASGSR